ncbi:hypothetical protein LSTR_LSTR002273 [Laodelphax striatellus]|uniref:Uncharacterized protein n=1 Tax=Laodelphax striatellus TaxID=195883 RepID=A0A482XFZ2_LAOST|nr:hypothetical protein LSTR_LSTR002273 [Laodelphax striatellus]
MAGSGFSAGLRASLFINYSDGFSSFSSSWGYHVYAGAPGSFVNARALARVLRKRAANFYSFTSTRMERSKGVMELPMRYRPCMAPERKLAAFKTYTMANCKAECTLNTTLKLCNCVPFITPKYSDDQRFCDFSDLKCLHTNREAMTYISSGTNLSQFSENRFEIEFSRPCNCYPSCEAFYDFDVSTSSSPIHMKLIPEYVRQTNFTRKYGKNVKDMEYFGEIYVYSQGNMLTKIKTNVKYDVTDFLGFLGTIASFTMGWSIICVVEILHFLIQLAINYCINKIKEARQVEQFHPD